MLTDETWRQLDPYAGRLSRRDLGRALLAALVVVLLLVAGYATAASGLLAPRIVLGSGGGYLVDRETREATYDFDVARPAGR